MKRKILAVISDTHGNSRLGLLSPQTQLWDENAQGDIVEVNPTLNPIQEQLWDWYLEDKYQIEKLADGDEIVLVHNGDMTHGNKYMSEMVSTRMSDQIPIAAAALRPWLRLKNVKKAFFVKGTPSHEFGEGSAPLLVAEVLRNELDVEITVPFHVEIDIDGFRADMFHHGGHPGTRNWLKGNSLRYYVQSVMDDFLKNRKEPPDALVSGHFHQCVVEHVQRYGLGERYWTWGAICPSYGFPDSYARKAARSPRNVTVGALAFELIDGKLIGEPHEFTRTVDHRTRSVV